MKALFVLFALVAAGFALDTLYDGMVMTTEVPKSGSLATTFHITADMLTLNGGDVPDVELFVEFGSLATSVAKSLNVSISSATKTSAYHVFSKTTTTELFPFDLSTFTCPSTGCDLTVTFVGHCLLCLKSITTTFGPRVLYTGETTYLYATDVLPFITIVPGFWTQPLKVLATPPTYFQYNATATDAVAGILVTKKSSQFLSAVTILSGGLIVGHPTNTNNTWFQTTTSALEVLPVGTNYIGMYGDSTFSVGTVKGQICFGTCSGASLVAPFLTLLALLALLL